MVVDRKNQTIQIEPVFKNILKYLQSTDVLVYNSTRVSKRRVYLYSSKGREHECVFLEPYNNSQKWICLVKNSRKLSSGDFLFTKNQNFRFQYFKESDKSILVSEIPLIEEVFEKIGTIPIPPYMKRKSTFNDEERYQTIFAVHSGSVAAPTAGLHFSVDLRKEILQRKIAMKELYLQIGYGTFAPLEKEQIESKKLHVESYCIPQETAEYLNQKKGNGKIISIGTTTLRALESCLDKQQKFQYGDFQTDIFIQPGDQIHSIDGLITNFHLPQSSLLLLVCAFGGKDLLMKAYHKAIEEKMRFYSYGDAMLIL
jgi:S-adenosylmethionine:tRNA ribosyltransferase-isomerase